MVPGGDPLHESLLAEDDYHHLGSLAPAVRAIEKWTASRTADIRRASLPLVHCLVSQQGFGDLGRPCVMEGSPTPAVCGEEEAFARAMLRQLGHKARSMLS